MTVLPALWDHEVDVEVLEALSTIYAALTDSERAALVEAILSGPPYDDETRAQFEEDSIEYQVYLRLEALGDDARAEHEDAEVRYRAILDSHAAWAGTLDERIRRREPQVYSKSLVKKVEGEVAPQTLVAEILSRGIKGADEFHTLAGLSMASRSAAIKHAYEQEDGESVVRVLLSIGKDDLADDSSRRNLLRMLADLPADLTSQAHREVASLLDSISEQIEPGMADQFLIAWDRVLPACLSERDEVFVDGPPDYLTGAINSSSGRTTHALLKLLGKSELQRDAGISPPFRDRLELVVRSSEPGGFYGRVLVASRLYLLSWLDLAWTTTELTPRLSWTDPIEAAGAWQGYLWSPRLDGRLFDAIRSDFVESFSHVDELRGTGESLCGLLVSLALDAPGKMTSDETRRCLRAMGTPSRQRVAWLLAKRLEATEEDKRPDLWRDRIDSWISQHWPVETDYADGDVSERLAWAATFAGAAFAEAVETIRPLMTSTGAPVLTLSALHESDLCERFPEECLSLLDRLLGEAEDRHYLHGVASILRRIRSANPNLGESPSYVRLYELAQSVGDSS